MSIDAGVAARPSSRAMATIWWLYFVMYAGVGAYLTYLNVYLISQGMTGLQLGWISVGVAAGVMLGSTFWGHIADRTGKTQYIMAGGAVVASVFSLLYLKAGGNFWIFLALGSGYAFFNTAFTTIIESTTLQMLGDRREDYGRYRLGGTFGYILGTAGTGFLFDLIGMTWMFPIYAGIMLTFAAIALRLPSLPVRPAEKGSHSLGALFRMPVWFIFLLCAFLMGLAINGAINYVGVTIKGMGGSDSLIGLAATSSAVFEIPFMYFSGNIMRRIGVRNMLWAGMFFFIIRIFLYGAMPHPAWAIGINAMNGVSYIFFWIGSVNYVNQNAPAHLKATMQGIFQGTMALANMAGAMLAGLMFDTVGIGWMFRVLSVCCLLAFIIFGVSQRRNSLTSQPNTE